MFDLVTFIGVFDLGKSGLVFLFFLLAFFLDSHHVFLVLFELCFLFKLPFPLFGKSVLQPSLFLLPLLPFLLLEILGHLSLARSPLPLKLLGLLEIPTGPQLPNLLVQLAELLLLSLVKHLLLLLHLGVVIGDSGVDISLAFVATTTEQYFLLLLAQKVSDVPTGDGLSMGALRCDCQ